MSYLRSLCSFTYSGGSHILWRVCHRCVYPMCVASFSGLSILIASSVFSNIYSDRTAVASFYVGDIATHKLIIVISIQRILCLKYVHW